MAAPLRRGTLSPGATRFWDSDEWGWRPLWVTSERIPPAVRSAFGITVDRAELLVDGLLNQSWLLRCAGHDRVLRISRPDRSVAQVRYERRFAAAVGSDVPAVALAEPVTCPRSTGTRCRCSPSWPGAPDPRSNRRCGAVGRRSSWQHCTGRHCGPGCRVEPLVWEVAQVAYGSRAVPPERVWRWYRDAGGPLPEADLELLPEFARVVR